MTILLSAVGLCAWFAVLFWWIARSERRERERYHRLGIVHGHRRGTRFESEREDF